MWKYVLFHQGWRWTPIATDLWIHETTSLQSRTHHPYLIERASRAQDDDDNDDDIDEIHLIINFTSPQRASFRISVGRLGSTDDTIFHTKKKRKTFPQGAQGEWKAQYYTKYDLAAAALASGKEGAHRYRSKGA